MQTEWPYYTRYECHLVFKGQIYQRGQYNIEMDCSGGLNLS